MVKMLVAEGGKSDGSLITIDHCTIGLHTHKIKPLPLKCNKTSVICTFL